MRDVCAEKLGAFLTSTATEFCKAQDRWCEEVLIRPPPLVHVFICEALQRPKIQLLLAVH